MTTQPALVAKQVRLKEWAKQIHDCQNRPKGMDIETKDRFICWAADMDLRYDRVFSIVDIEKENLQKWGKILPFYQNVQKEGIVLWKAA